MFIHSKRFRFLSVLVLVSLVLMPVVSVKASGVDPRPGPASPGPDPMSLPEGTGGGILSFDSMSLSTPAALGSAFQSAGNRLTALQNNDGGWDWPLDDGNPASASPVNTIGPIGKGLAEIYLHTGDTDHLDALQAAGALLLTKTNNFSPSDGYLAAQLDEIFGGTTYTDHVVNNFYSPLAAGTYDRNGLGTLYDTAGYVTLIRNSRASQGIPNLAAWDVGMGLVAAASCSADTTAWVAGVKSEIDELDGDDYYDVVGLAGALYGLAFVGEDFDPQAGEHVAAASLMDLAAILAGYQISGGGFTWNSGFLSPGDKSIQETAYAILALNEVNRALYLDELRGAADYMISVQLGTGGFEQDTGSGENNEVTAEGVWGISVAYPELWVCTSGDCGHPGASYNTLQAAVNAIELGGNIYIAAGTFGEAGQIVIDKSMTIDGQGCGNTIISPLQNTGSGNVDAGGWWLVDAGAVLNLSDVTLDGTGYKIWQAMRFNGSGSIDAVCFDEIKYEPSTSYQGTGVRAKGDGPVHVTNSTFSEIGRIGVHYGSTGTSGSVYDNNSYIGKGVGTWLDYGVELGWGVQATVSNSNISGNLGVATDGSTSAGILVTDYFAPGTQGTITGNTLTGNTTGIAVGYLPTDASSVSAHSNCISGNTSYGISSTGVAVVADNNWWGNVSGPYHSSNPTGLGDDVSDNVSFTPWLNACGGSPTANFKNVDTGGYYSTLQEAVNDAAYGDTVIPLSPGPWPGTTTVNTNGVTIDLSGATFTGGSSALVISADDVTVMGPGVFDGGGDLFPAIVVNAGADNFILDGVEIKGWSDGVQVAGAVESLKIVNNWIHDNTYNGLLVDVLPTGVVTIEGNLFKDNDGLGVEYNGAGTLDATYNSWGDDAGPTGPLGDGIGTSVDGDPWTFSEIYFDVDPDTIGDQEVRHVAVNDSFDVAIMGDAENLYGLSFAFSYDDTNLTFNSVTFSAPWTGGTGGNCDAMQPALLTGQIGYFCSLSDPDVEWDGGMIAKFNFTATVAADSFFDVFTNQTLSSGAVGGVKVFVNNAGYNDPSVPARDITDGDDGHIYIDLSNFTGFIDLQGRPNDSGALVQVYDTDSGTTLMATGTSVSSGKYTTAHVSGQMLTLTNDYYLYVDRSLYLPTYGPPYLSAELDTSPLTALNQLLLLGGDATDNNVIDIGDAGIIGAAYGSTGVVCGPSSCVDVNGDGVVNIYDLTLMGGNYNKTTSPWTPE